MHSSYDTPLVALSILIAILASYTALALAWRVTVTRGRARRAWLLGGSIAMGSGIWSMHFVAMLAFRLPVSVAYHGALVFLSLLVAILASALALFVASRESVGTPQLLAAGSVMGGGIATMHYVGMAAMRMSARLDYDPLFVALSGVIAVSASTVALWIFRWLRPDNSRRSRSLRGGAAVLLGGAIAGSHYTAMTAAHFAPLSAPAAVATGVVIATGVLAAAVVVGTVLILVLTVAGALVDHWVRLKVAGAQALRESEERYRSLVSEVHEVIFRTDAAGRWIFLNPAWTEITGFTHDESLGTALADYVHPDDRPGELDAFRQIDEGTASSSRREVRYLTKKGGFRWLEVHARVNRDAMGALVGTAGTLRDITERRSAEDALRAAEERLIHQARHDPLTGLANRVLFRDRVHHALARAARGEHVAVLFLDLDDFKHVNDRLGHAEGDRVLTMVGERLLKATRGYDTVSRLGGDEFAILLEDMAHETDVLPVLDRITTAMRRPIIVAAREIRIDTSIGVAHVRVGESVEDVLRNADLAMYRAKAKGKRGYEVFEPSMHSEVLERLELEADLRLALERGEFRLVYQPIVELATGHPLGVEALIRWQHASRGCVMPSAFIPLAEETGLIVPIGRWALTEALNQGREWQRRCPNEPAPVISVNLSGRQLVDSSLVDDVAAAIASSGLEPCRVTLEITESVLMNDTDTTLQTLRRLKKLGVRLAIDDFGTGYSSLSYLHRFPIDVLKIDKAFIDGVARNSSDAALARTIVTLAGMLDLNTVAEGVESADQRAQLVALGCVQGQGYLFARPLTPEAIGLLLDQANARAAAT